MVKTNRYIEYIEVGKGNQKFKAHYIRGVFAKHEMQELAQALDESKHWEHRKDKTRGDKDFFITGRWAAQGHARHGIDHDYPAGKAGKSDQTERNNVKINEILARLSVKASMILRKYRLDIFNVVDGLDSPYGLFHLFMTPRGVSKMHRDKNDLISLMFLMRKSKNGGELEMGGTDHGIDWDIGDVILLDSSKIPHGTRSFDVAKDSRMVGLFIIHKSYCRLHGRL